jgi:hypothetical protein
MPAILPDSISMLFAMSAPVKPSLPLSLQRPDLFTAALAWRREEEQTSNSALKK